MLSMPGVPPVGLFSIPLKFDIELIGDNHDERDDTQVVDLIGEVDAI